MSKEMELYCPEGYKKLSKIDKEEICNGCGPKGWKFDFVPDKIWGLNIYYICCIHDFMYFEGVCIEDKEEADRVFLNNMLRLIDFKTRYRWLRWLRKQRAYKYYLAVKHFGGPAFWEGKNQDNNIIKRQEMDKNTKFF
jgi:hypothetical protein